MSCSYHGDFGFRGSSFFSAAPRILLRGCARIWGQATPSIPAASTALGPFLSAAPASTRAPSPAKITRALPGFARRSFSPGRRFLSATRENSLPPVTKFARYRPFFSPATSAYPLLFFFAGPLENLLAPPQILSWPALPFSIHHRLKAAARFDTPPCFFLRLSAKNHPGYPHVFLAPPHKFSLGLPLQAAALFPVPLLGKSASPSTLFHQLASSSVSFSFLLGLSLLYSPLAAFPPPNFSFLSALLLLYPWYFSSGY